MKYFCGKCGVEKDEDQFYKNPHCKFGINRSECRDCRKLYRKATRTRDRAYRRDYDALHPGKRHSYNAIYYKLHKEYQKERVKKWREANPDKQRVIDIRRYLKAKESGKLQEWNRKSQRRRYYNDPKYLQMKAAHAIVRAAIADGSLVPKPCEVCGSSKDLHAHHYKGYEVQNAKMVKWLCRKHHRQVHGKVSWW